MGSIWSNSKVRGDSSILGRLGSAIPVKFVKRGAKRIAPGRHPQFLQRWGIPNPMILRNRWGRNIIHPLRSAIQRQALEGPLGGITESWFL